MGQTSNDRAPFWWMWPIWLVGSVRSGLREAALADRRWLDRVPVPRVALPALAIFIPLVITVLHARTPPGEQPAPELLAVVIRDVFTESVPFMAVALALGIISPAAGALLTVVFGAGNLLVTFISGELDPIFGATFGRLVSYAVLWMLVVEIPLIGRWIAEWTMRSEDASAGRRVTSVAFGGVAIAFMTFVWAQAAPMLITIVYFTTSAWGNPFLAAVQPLQEHGRLFAAVAAGAGFIILAWRYMGAGPRLSPPIRPIAASTQGWRLAGYVASVAVPLALMSGLIHAPIDLAVLLIGLLAARPLGAAIASATGLTKLLAGIPLPLRLVLGIVLAGLINKAYFSVFFDIDTSRFFHANVAIILDLIVISVVAAPGVTGGRQLRTGSASPASLIVVATAAALAWPTPVFADNCGDWIDCVGDQTRAAVAAAAAAAIFAAKFLWDWARDVFGAPQPIGTLDKLASEEGAAAQDGAMSMLRGQAANRALENGDTDRYSQIRNMSNGEFYQAAQRGDFSDLGIGPF